MRVPRSIVTSGRTFPVHSFSVRAGIHGNRTPSERIRLAIGTRGPRPTCAGENEASPAESVGANSPALSRTRTPAVTSVNSQGFRSGVRFLTVYVPRCSLVTSGRGSAELLPLRCPSVGDGHYPQGINRVSCCSVPGSALQDRASSGRRKLPAALRVGTRNPNKGYSGLRG